VCKMHKRCAHEHTGSAEAIRPSLRNGFTAYNALSPVTGFVATVIPEKLASHELDTSVGVSGPHDFAVRKLSALVFSAACVHRIPLHVRDDRERPSCGAGRRDLCGDLRVRKIGIFLQKRLDRPSPNCAGDLPVGPLRCPLTFGFHSPRRFS